MRSSFFIKIKLKLHTECGRLNLFYEVSETGMFLKSLHGWIHGVFIKEVQPPARTLFIYPFKTF